MVSAEATELTLPWWALDFARTTAIRSKVAARFAPATAHRMLAALRGVLKASFKLGLIDSDKMTRACSVDAVRGTRVPKGRALSRGELTLIGYGSHPPEGQRKSHANRVRLGHG